MSDPITIPALEEQQYPVQWVWILKPKLGIECVFLPENFTEETATKAMRNWSVEMGGIPASLFFDIEHFRYRIMRYISEETVPNSLIFVAHHVGPNNPRPEATSDIMHKPAQAVVSPEQAAGQISQFVPVQDIPHNISNLQTAAIQTNQNFGEYSVQEVPAFDFNQVAIPNHLSPKPSTLGQVPGEVTDKNEDHVVIEVKAADKPRIKRPANAWILFRRDKVKQGIFAGLGLTAGQISKHLSPMWENASPDVKKYYSELAAEEDRQHKIRHPSYKYTPRRPAKVHSG